MNLHLSIFPRFLNPRLCAARLQRAVVAARTLTQHLHQGTWALFLVLFSAVAPYIDASAANSGNKVQPTKPAVTTPVQDQCLPDHQAYLRAHLSGALNAELSWDHTQVRCAGSARPDAQGTITGLRLRFSYVDQSRQPLVLLFGITGLREGESGKALPVNVTIMREGSGEFYGTQGDNKCTIDDLRQEPLSATPRRDRSYRVIARGFCTQPARALNGDGSVLVTRFDFAGRVDFAAEDDTSDKNSSATTT
jgi:hypothetical protein